MIFNIFYYQVTMNINEINYIFQYPADLDSTSAAQAMSEQFCKENAVDVGIDLKSTSEDDLIKICIVPLTAGLLKEMNA